MRDLFGNRIDYKTPTVDDKYQQYINSSAWKRLREAKIKQVGGCCEHCGISKWSVKLEVHHKTYERMGKERLDDLQVLCPACHIEADQERREEAHIEKITKKHSSPLVRGFAEWMDNGSNRNWRSYNDARLEFDWKKFLVYLSNMTGRKYDAKFWRDPDW